MKKVWSKDRGFGEIVGSYIYGRQIYLRVRWDADPWFVDDVLESEVETC